MLIATALTFLATLLPAAAAAEANEPLTLDGAFSRAVAVSEELGRQVAAVDEAGARTDEMFAVLLPRLSLRATQSLRQGSSDPARAALFPPSQTESRLSLHQGIPIGFREVALVEAARAQGRSLAFQLSAARDRLYLDVARALLDWSAWREELRNRESLVQIARRRVDDLRARERLGRARASEVIAARAQLAQLEAQIEDARGDVASAEERVRFLTGLEGPIAPAPIARPAVGALAEHLGRTARRPELRAREHEVIAAEAAKRAARAGRWPSLALDVNAYPYRTGFQASSRWDMLVTLDVPLFSGGAVLAQIRQAESRQRAAELSLRLARRSAETEVRSLHRDAEQLARSASAFDEAMKLAESNVAAQLADEKVGQAANLDVIGAINTFRELRLRRDGARSQALLAAIRLAIASGDGPGATEEAR